MNDPKGLENDIFEIIAYSGNAKALGYEALKAAEDFDFSKAEEQMKQAEKELNLAHNVQTRLIQEDLNGEGFEKSMLLIHAQDHLMTALSEQKLIEHFIRIIRKLKDDDRK